MNIGSFPTDGRNTADYWLKRYPNGDAVWLTAAECRAANEHMRAKATSLVDLAAAPATVGRDALREMILSAQQDFRPAIAPGEHYDSDGRPISQENFAAARQNCNLASLAGKTAARYAVTGERTNLRLLPTPQNYFDQRDFRHYDDLQGTALDPAEPLLLLHESLDGDYAFVQARHYAGWVRRRSLALTERTVWEKYVRPAAFLTVTANKKHIAAGGEQYLFQMGSVLPLDMAEPGKADKIRLPRLVQGGLQETKTILPLTDDGTLHQGWLPATPKNFLRQAFRFLGDVYGWGGMEDSVDCSAFVGDIYRSMGLELPRDADQQELAMPISVPLAGLSTEKRYAEVRKAPVGALLFKPGHVMMYLGADDEGTPFAIHAASSYFTFGGGKREKHFIRRVLVSDLRLLNSQGIEAIDSLTSIGYLKAINAEVN